MPSLSSIAYYATHPNELRAIVQWQMWHNPPHERKPDQETPELRKCFEFLDLTSRSFAAVIKELHPELLVPVCLFYLVLRGLDTIEDDMTIKLDEKDPLLRNFYNHLEEDGWTYEGNHVREKDRDLLVQFHYVITEFKKIKPAYKKIIKDIAKRMGDGMADYCNNAEHNENGVDTIEDYEKYCHYVAGLVGEGLTRLFVESELANPILLKRPDLMESMGQFLQQTNIIRDIREDWEDKRRFWPREVWSKYVDNFEDLFKPENKEKALNASSELVHNALKRADDCLYYLAGLREQSVFNFCAIPQSMAIATLTLCFRNADMFQRNIKITKGEACLIMTESTQNLKILCEVFKSYARKIHAKNTPKDPNFLNISIACGRIEQFIETIFPQQKPGHVKTTTGKLLSPEEVAKQKQDNKDNMWDMVYLMLAVFATLAVVTGIMLFIAWLAGARFDIAFSEMRKGNIMPPKPGSPEAADAMSRHAHVEL